MKTLILIPTYNEADNIGILLNKILSLDKNYDILVIDDNSKDGTIEIISQYMYKSGNIDLIIRYHERGLGTALFRGYLEAYNRGYDILVQIDADLQHPPEYIPYLVDIIKDGYDVALGSRYVKGGEVGEWSFLRRMISKWANLYAKIILGISAGDVTTGFRAFSKRALEFIINRGVKSKGFLIQVETLYILEKSGYKIKEYPIKFSPRSKGSSKLNYRIILEYFIKVPMIRFS